MVDPVFNDIGMKLFTTPHGDEYYAFQKASLEEELAMEEDNNIAEDFPIEYDYEDPDSDGYGWERQALNKVWM